MLDLIKHRHIYISHKLIFNLPNKTEKLPYTYLKFLIFKNICTVQLKNSQ